MNDEPTIRHLDLPSLADAVDAAARQIPPLWPLATSVAVNPYLGQTQETLAQAGARLARVGAGPVTMPRRWYLDRMTPSENSDADLDRFSAISDADLDAALAASPHGRKPADVMALKAAASESPPAPRILPTVVDLAARAAATDWHALVDERVGAWASGYFDQGQALWAAPLGKSAWAAFCAQATHDLTPEIMGLKGFAAFVADRPADPMESIAATVRRLRIHEAALPSYFHQLLLSLGGWAHYARYQLWRAELADHTDSTITDLLAIRLLWEEALFDQHEAAIGEEWKHIRTVHEEPIEVQASDIVDEILQESAERAAQRELQATLAEPEPAMHAGRPTLQAAFCIDVRSEVFRRSLEAIHPSIRTLGFAGFFGVFARHRSFASDVDELRLPVLLNPNVCSSASGSGNETNDLATRYEARARRAWGRFKLAAVSSFAFVEAMGPVYVGKLVRDALGMHSTPTPNDPMPRFDPPLDLETRINAAETVLRAMTLTDDFARLVLLVGHGANVVNNPQASALHCGACGGHSGEVNARLLASMLNDKQVRAGLAARELAVPGDTLFVGALHDTTTDKVTLYEQDADIEAHVDDLDQARQWLMEAGRITCAERALRLPRAANGSDIEKRARDWAEVRPEWALAGCQAFIAAPRSTTAGRRLEGSAFLHDYDWQQDSVRGFGVLELIMTAPVVVASWISLQYYGSSVAPHTFGSGNKLLQNVVGGIGVVEGNGGLLRAGLPWQSVHDGEYYSHEPLRLSVSIQAPREAMNDILGRNDEVRALFDNRWLHLFAMDEKGRLAHRYRGGLDWEIVEAGTASADLKAGA